MNHLQEVEITKFRGSKHEVNFVKQSLMQSYRCNYRQAIDFDSTCSSCKISKLKLKKNYTRINASIGVIEKGPVMGQGFADLCTQSFGGEDVTAGEMKKWVLVIK